MADRILVVDDEEAIREIVASMLSSAGYACKQAGSGMEALAVLNSAEEFELMLSDLMMADLDGIGLLERTKEKYPDMPVVMVTCSSRSSAINFWPRSAAPSRTAGSSWKIAPISPIWSRWSKPAPINCRPRCPASNAPTTLRLKPWEMRSI
jgi:CheY-like chemotaxis protein